jgi:histone acetyltransferase (RNA polymerase elongator complex component)
VGPLRTEEYADVSKTLLVWKQVAHEKSLLAQESKDKKTFAASSRYCSSLAQHLVKSEKFTFLACKDQSGSLQGVMDLSIDRENCVNVYFLVANPSNIRSPLNAQNGQVKGAGSALCDAAELLVSDEDLDCVKLIPTDYSKEFYAKRDYSTGGIYMRKTIAKIRRALSEEKEVA